MDKISYSREGLKRKKPLKFDLDSIQTRPVYSTVLVPPSLAWIPYPNLKIYLSCWDPCMIDT